MLINTSFNVKEEPIVNSPTDAFNCFMGTELDYLIIGNCVLDKKMQDPKSSVRFLVGTPQTGGYGITLTGASTMIYYSNGYDLEKRQQSEARIDRIGQKKPMTYIDIIAEKTVDEKIVTSLKKKVNIATQVMGEDLKAWI